MKKRILMESFGRLWIFGQEIGLLPLYSCDVATAMKAHERICCQEARQSGGSYYRRRVSGFLL